MTQRFSGHNELDAAFNAAMLTVVNTLALVTALGGSTAAWGLWVAGLVLTPVIYFGSRYRVSVGPSGVELVRYHLWPLWRQKTTYFLDVGIDLYDTWDSDRAQGVYLRAAAIAEADSEAFGPYWDAEAMSALVDRVSRAITEQRKAVGRPRGLRLDGFDASAFEVHDRSPGGPPLRLLSREALTVLGVSIPSGSRFALNRPGWVDPARTDVLQCITVADATVLPNGVEIARGATLRYSPSTGCSSKEQLCLIPLKRGSVDIAECQKRGLVAA